MAVAPVKTEPMYESPGQPTPRGRRRKRRQVDPAVYISIFAAVVLVAALVHVGQRARVASLTYDMHQALARLDQLQREQRRLIVEVERARSLARIESDARLRLGMVRPESDRLFVVQRPTDTESGDGVLAEPTRGSWFAAFSRWYDRVSSHVRAALPRSVRTTD